MCSFQVEPTKITPTYLVQDSISNISHNTRVFVIVVVVIVVVVIDLIRYLSV